MGLIDFAILGPVRVRAGAGEVGVTASKRRALLALLLLNHGRPVATDVLIEELWGPEPPKQAASTLQAHVSHLRRTLGRDAPAIEAQPPGYVLRVDPEAIDLVRCERLAALGRAAWAAGDAAEAAQHLQDALALWRGRPLEDLADFAFAEREATRLEDLRLGLLRERIEVDLALGREREIVAELAALAEAHPFDERLAGQHLIALYRLGRQADALRAYQQTRRRLVEELGIEPGPELREIEQAILSQEPGLDAARAGREAAPAPEEGPLLATTDGAAALRPTGTVTFLFTDIERSTFLWDQAPKAMARALQQHDDLLFGTVEAHHGYVFSHAGDGVGAVFARSRDALEAAVEAQQLLLDADWDEIEPLRVRMALHTGEADERAGNYFGPTLNRTARLRDAGHGGQILVSETARQVVLDAGAGGAGARRWDEQHFKDLGSWLFDGVSRAERVYQVLRPELPSTFPRLRSGRSEAGRLPRRTTSFIGRDADRAAIGDLLRAHPLVTLLGEGGIGKTRLAIAVAGDHAERSPNGVWFCDLSEVVDASGLVEQVALCLGLAPAGAGDLRHELVTSLRSASLLLVLDNCEQLRAEVGELVDEILRATTDVTILATSRAPLRVDGEHLFAVRPLALPPREHEAPELVPSGLPALGPAPATEVSPAVTLLVERARAAGAVVHDGDPALDEIARRLDGVPLALELAAPRLATMTPDALVARLDKRFDLLTRDVGGGPERQRALRATLDWSLGLLTPASRDLYNALAVCAGGWTLETAEAIAPSVGLAAPSAAMVLAHLVDMSMVQLDTSTVRRGRYSMLETVRAYGAERLEASGRRPAVLAAHAEHFVGLAEHAARERRGPGEGAWVAVIESEFDNLRVAFRSLMDDGRLADASRLLLALVDEVILRERQEVTRWALELCARPDGERLPQRGIALAIASNAAMIEGRLDDATRYGRASIELEPAAVGAAPREIEEAATLAGDVVGLRSSSTLSSSTPSSSTPSSLEPAVPPPLPPPSTASTHPVVPPPTRASDPAGVGTAGVEVGPAAVTTWVGRNTMALLSVAGIVTDRWEEHLDAMARIADLSGDPMGRAVALYDRVLISTLMGHPERGGVAADELLALAERWNNPTMRAMGLLSRARALAGEDPAAVPPLLFEGLDLASSVGNTLLVNEATRAIVETRSHQGDQATALASLRAVLLQFERAGDVHQQLRTILGMLDSLLAMDALRLVVVICGALSQTPWGFTASCRVVDRLAGERLGPQVYQEARAQGIGLEPVELIALVASELERLVGNGPDGP